MEARHRSGGAGLRAIKGEIKGETRRLSREKDVLIKVLAVLKRADWMTHDEFVEYWQSTHIPLVKKLPGLRTFVCNVVVDEFKQSNYPAVDQYDGMSELCFDDLEAADRAFNSEQGRINGEDAKNFIGQRLFMATEVVDDTDLQDHLQDHYWLLNRRARQSCISALTLIELFAARRPSCTLKVAEAAGLVQEGQA